MGAKVGIFTVSGERVISLSETAGWAYWDGKNEAGRDAAAGTYYYIVEAGAERLQTGKLVVVWR